MKKIILLLSAVASLSACSGGSGNNKPTSGGDVSPVDPTTLAECAGEIPVGLTLQSYPWAEATNDESEFKIKTVFVFSDSRVHQASTGTLYGSSKTISVESRMKVTGDSLEIFDDVSDEAEIVVGSNSAYFAVRFTPIVLKYSFQGKCLKLKVEGYPDSVLTPMIGNNPTRTDSVR